MIKYVHIIGERGNMAARYKAILDYLDVKWTGHDFDRDLSFPTIYDLCEEAGGFLICTPTEWHLTNLEEYLQFDKPILIEKPISKNLKDLEEFAEKYHSKLHLITMVDQYNFLARTEKSTDVCTTYDYFKSGKDGLFWDCINIIGRHDETKRLNIVNESPIWNCKINGWKFHLSDMDQAYVDMVEEWLANHISNIEYALEAHRKVQKCLTY